MSDSAWSDALLAAALFAVDPGLGVSVHALPGPVRDWWLADLRRVLPPGAPLRRVPLHIADDRLLGGLDLTATLRAGHPVAAQGLLAEADGGVVLLAMAERVSAGVAGRIAAALDSGEVVTERDGVALRRPTSFGVVALDEGLDDERPPPALLDRLALRLDLTDIAIGVLKPGVAAPLDLDTARALLPLITVPDEVVGALASVAEALGVRSLRALLLATRAARASAALCGRPVASEADGIIAGRLVLAPRATRVPSAPPPESPPGPPPEASSDSAGADGADDQASQPPPDMGEIVLQAARAAMPAGLLAGLLAGGAKLRSASVGKAGAVQASAVRGRPIGVRRGALRSGARLNVIETLRAAAPWQPLRRRTAAVTTRLLVLPDDVRVQKFRQRTETTTIFVVDASGSAALNRLAEAKGAVELVLADCYVRRDRVALIAFRGLAAELLLPPTGSLVRAKRSLAALPGGGGTPLAAGLAAALALAAAVRRRGQTPVVILLSDGRANVARDGGVGRAHAEEDAWAAGRLLKAAGLACVLVDTSPRPAPQARRLAEEMGARYLPLPYADAAAVARAVRA